MFVWYPAIRENRLLELIKLTKECVNVILTIFDKRMCLKGLLSLLFFQFILLLIVKEQT